MKPIKLSPELELPGDAATQKLAFLARSGAGKTYGAGVFVEQLAAAGDQVVVIDPVGVWWGLRLAADGKRPGIATVYVFGGLRGDVPLDPVAGELVANLIVDLGISVVLDVSDMTGGEMRRFVADFGVHLLKRKKSARSPLMVVYEECQDFVPQRVTPDSARMVGALERLIKQGRNFGVGTTLISQRPQAVNKDVLNQTECLIVLQLTGPHERKAIRTWVAENDVAGEEALEKLPELARGEAFVWSPQWLRTFKRIRIGKKWTFDASSTPDFRTATTVAKLAEVDKDAILAAMQDITERQREEDPKALREQVHRLTSELARAQKAAPAPERVEVPVVGDHQVAELRQLAGGLRDVADVLIKALGSVYGAARAPRTTTAAATATMESVGRFPPRAATPASRQASSRDAGDGLKRGARVMLEQVARMGTLTRHELATLSGMSPGSGSFSNYLGALKRAGYILEEGGHDWSVTEAGRARAGAVPPRPMTTADLVEMWSAKFKRGARSMLGTLVQHYPRAVTRQQLGAIVSMDPGSGSFSNYLGALRRNGLITTGRDGITASATLFPEARS